MKSLSILIADDQAVVRRGVRALLEAQPGWEVVAEAADGREAVAKAKQHRPDLIILDVAMPELNGLEATRQIRKLLPEARVLMLTMHDEQEVIESTLRAGAAGYVLKSDAEQDLVSAVKALANRRTFFTSTAREVALNRSRRPLKEQSRHVLSPRESEVVQLLAEGKSNKQIAGILGISQRTAENHRAKIMHKLGLHSFSDLVRYAIRHNIIEA
jgi:DNA-binding NarL/FixJ family response regulator